MIILFQAIEAKENEENNKDPELKKRRKISSN